jgi:hypothetical protein
MRLSLVVLMLNMFFVGWCLARDDMLWMGINAAFAGWLALSFMYRLKPSKA